MLPSFLIHSFLVQFIKEKDTPWTPKGMFLDVILRLWVFCVISKNDFCGTLLKETWRTKAHLVARKKH